MRDFSKGITRGPIEDEYQAWLREHPTATVLSLNRGRDGRFTLHRAPCQTLSYDLEAAGHRDRSGRICCENDDELNGWLGNHAIQRGDLNTCSRCMGPSAGFPA